MSLLDGLMQFFGQQTQQQPKNTPWGGEVSPATHQHQLDILRQEIFNARKNQHGQVLGAQATPTPVPQQTQQPQQQMQQPVLTGIEQFFGRNPAIAKTPPPENIQHIYDQVAQQFGGDNPQTLKQLLYDISLQESHYHPNSINKTPEGIAAGTPQGLFQFTDGTWNGILNNYNNKGSLKLPTTDRLDPLTNAMAAAFLISHGQVGRWNASRNIWGPNYTKDEIAPYYSQTQPQYFPQQGWKQ